MCFDLQSIPEKVQSVPPGSGRLEKRGGSLSPYVVDLSGMDLVFTKAEHLSDMRLSV